MTTLPPEIHRQRQMAESFGVDPERYDRARPSYPDALIERIVATSPGRDVLEVGCGTGIAARQFQAAGCTVLGVDPDERMAGFARRTGVEVEVATFEDWDPAGRQFDAVVAGQSWHWVDPVAGPAKALRVLRPGGRLAVFSHVFVPPAAVAAALSYPQDPVDVGKTVFAKVVDGFREAGFAGAEQWRFDWERTYTRDEWLDLLPTTGGLTRLPADKLAEVLAEVGAAIGDDGFTTTHLTLVATGYSG